MTQKLRIGSVPYLNAKPLVYGIEDQIHFEVPSLLAKKLRKGILEAALVPTAECLEYPGYKIIPNISISSQSKVQSVYLAHREPLDLLEKVYLDPSSKTSALLLRLIFRLFLKLNPRFVSFQPKKFPSLEKKAAYLFIGDPALLLQKPLKARGFDFLDLGEVWRKYTRLPFVYALWAIRKEADIPYYTKILSQAKNRGLKNISKIIQNEHRISPKIAQSYLFQSVSYRLGISEQKSLHLFQTLCFEQSLLKQKIKIRFA